MTYTMDENNVITSITIDGVTFETNIQTDGTWSVFLPTVSYDENDVPVNITVSNLNFTEDNYQAYNTDGSAVYENIGAPEILPNKIFIQWPISSGYNYVHFYKNGEYHKRSTVPAMANGNTWYNLALPFDAINIVFCKDKTEASHSAEYVIEEPGTYRYETIEEREPVAIGE